MWARGAVCVVAMVLAGCQQRDMASEGEGPKALVHPVVDGAAFQVEVGLVQNGVAGTVYVTDYLHPELEGNEALARRVAQKACEDLGRVFDMGSAGEAWTKASWAFEEACR